MLQTHQQNLSSTGKHACAQQENVFVSGIDPDSRNSLNHSNALQAKSDNLNQNIFINLSWIFN